MGIEDRPPANLSEEQAERLRMGIEDAVGRAADAGWNAAQIRTEVGYAIETADDG